MNKEYKSWGNIQSPSHVSVTPRIEPRTLDNYNLDDYVIYGNGRSYGDVCQNNNSGLLDTKQLDRFIEYDEEKSLITCQAGILLNDLLKYLVPKKRFVYVSPGTSYVTVGGMIANDVHGKNHHLVGSFGNHVESFKLLRSDRGLLTCSKKENSDLFYATIGGLGLTGLVLSATLRLKEIETPCIETLSIETHGIKDLIDLFDDDNAEFEYSVAWLDLHSKSLDGIFSYGKHAEETVTCGKIKNPGKVFINAPEWLLNRYTNAIFNRLYYMKNKLGNNAVQTYQDYFYPLDKLKDWNRLYGKRGFYQYQFVVPCEEFMDVFQEILLTMNKYRQISYLTVLKKFGEIESLGLMSFPRSGYTLAMDFPNLGAQTLKMFDEFDMIVNSAHGALYPAKDARMNADTFKKSFPQYKEFLKHRDDKFVSDFWRRVMVEHD